MANDDGPIVVGVDDSPGSRQALTWAIEEARRRHRDLRLVSAYLSELADARSRADALLAELLEEARATAGLTVEARAVDSEAAAALLAEADAATELVVGSRRRGPVASLVLGSVSCAVAATARCAVVVVRAVSPNGRGMAGDVVVGVDASEAAPSVLAYAFAQAAQRSTGLRAVSCWAYDPVVAVMGPSDAELSIRADQRLAAALADWQLRYPQVSVRRIVSALHPVDALTAEAPSAALLVVGKRGRRARLGTLIGSVSQGVLHHAPCPVAVVPPAGG